MTDIIDFHAAHRLVPVVVIDDVGAADPLAETLTRSGLPSAEITLRTPGALDALRVMAQHPGFVAGAGTVISPEQVAAAQKAGAHYVVSPGMSVAVARECAVVGMTMIPGVATATEVQTALDAGYDVLKFFPASAAGGAAMIQALSAPYPSVRFLPTGGIDAHDLPDYLCLHSVIAVGGTWMTPKSAIAQGQFELIGELTAAAVAQAGRFR
jgi:2-dehydro-3-deoxyphosphogluconate aldolase / (4S)-4-hydroxy-2-oxoglutarate aldolase